MDSSEVTNKISSAAKEIGDVLNNFGAQMFGSSKKQQETHSQYPEQHINNNIGGDIGTKLNFSDDDDETYQNNGNTFINSQQ